MSPQIKPSDFPLVPTHLVREFEAARRALPGVPPRLRYAYVTGRVEGMHHQDAIRYVQRVYSCWRRFKRDAKPCERCGHLVLFRREGPRLAVINANAKEHACAEDDRS